MNYIIYVLAIIGFLYIFVKIVNFIRDFYIMNIKTFFSDYRKVKSTKHFKEIQIKEKWNK